MEHVLPIFAGEELFILNCESDWWFGVIANERLEGKKVQDGRARSRHSVQPKLVVHQRLSALQSGQCSVVRSARS